MERIKNNEEKYQNYKVIKSKLKKAISNGYYIESVSILYAILEDRYNSILFHLGVLTKDPVSIKDFDSKQTLYSYKNYKYQVLKVLNLLDVDSQKRRPLNQISTKEYYLRLCMSVKEEDICEEEKYVRAVYGILTPEEKVQLIGIIDRTVKWREKRNKYVHVLMNINMYHRTNEEELKIFCEEGLAIEEELNSFRKKIKKADIRKKLKMNR